MLLWIKTLWLKSRGKYQPAIILEQKGSTLKFVFVIIDNKVFA